jgi:hypothetical protein
VGQRKDVQPWGIRPITREVVMDCFWQIVRSVGIKVFVHAMFLFLQELVALACCLSDAMV